MSAKLEVSPSGDGDVSGTLWEVGLCCWWSSSCLLLLRLQVKQGTSVVSAVCACIFGVMLVCALGHRAIFSFRYWYFSSSREIFALFTLVFKLCSLLLQ